ncbi:hypothetical protein I4U23_009507 [Adineta vaga]|nr:hypothetical protein I4U23_009507 [Adineta vaga]
MSTLIAQHYSKLEEWHQNGEVYQQNDDILNEICEELKRLQSSDDQSFQQDINKVTTLLSINIMYLNEVILTFLTDYFVQLLKQWREKKDFKNSNDSKTFDNISIILTNSYYCNYLDNASLIEEFNQCLYAIARIGKSMFINSNMTVINRLLINYISIQSSNKYCIINDSPFEDAIFKCVYASYTSDVVSQLKTSANSEERTPAEIFVFDCLLDFLSIVNRERLFEQALTLRKHLLPSIYELIKAYVVSWENWANSAISILNKTTAIFLYYVQMTVPNDQDLNVQIPLNDLAIQILLGNCRSIELHRNLIQYVYISTQSDKVLDHLKNKQLTPTMLKLTTIYKEESEIQFNIYRILAAIMTEDDIKRLDDSGAIAKVFLENLQSVISDSTWIVRLKNLLASLKILLQHDQIRDEIYKQSGLPLFIYCVTNTENDTLIRQRALENLIIMSFNTNVRNELKQNTDFLEHIKLLSENSADADLQHAAESLLWILTKDDTSESTSTNQSSDLSYDIMISYCHKDKDLCFQLYDRLQRDNFRVWLDRDQMHGTPLEAMSNAIEKAEFVFVCMSDGYKQSGYCKMEAYYALERQCSIIPLVMKAQYRPDGWLGIVVTGRMRVDFPKYGFEDAYKKLLIEIERTRKERKAETKSYPKPVHHETPSNDNVQIKEVVKKTYQAKDDHCLPSNIEQWSMDDVQQFFIKKNLENFLPICAQMTGTRLLAMYKMCLANSPIMFQSLNNELVISTMKEKKQVLAIAEYLQFLEDIKAFVPISIEKTDTNVPRSSLCVLI